MLTDLVRQSVAALRLLIAMTVILGIAYPLALWGVAQAFGDRASGQPVRVDGQVVGSRLVGQDFTGDQWFHPRPSPNDYDALASAPSNLGPANPELLTTIAERRAVIAEAESVAPSAVPADAVTGSGSGLDPQISVAYARLQATRVARAHDLSLATVSDLIALHTQGRFLGLHGEPAVNVLELNAAVMRASNP